MKCFHVHGEVWFRRECGLLQFRVNLGRQPDCGYVGEAISNHQMSRIAPLQQLLGLEQVRFLSLILGLTEGAGVPGLLQIDELLAEGGVGAVSIAISDGDAAVEQAES